MALNLVVFESYNFIFHIFIKKIHNIVVEPKYEYIYQISTSQSQFLHNKISPNTRHCNQNCYHTHHVCIWWSSEHITYAGQVCLAFIITNIHIHTHTNSKWTFTCGVCAALCTIRVVVVGVRNSIRYDILKIASYTHIHDNAPTMMPTMMMMMLMSMTMNNQHHTYTAQ